MIKINNLKFLRELTGATIKDVSSMIGFTAYTYKFFEEGKMIPDKIDLLMIAKLYGIDNRFLTCKRELIPEDCLIKLNKLSKLNSVERNNIFVFNLLGVKKNKLTFNEICEIKEELLKNRTN